MEKLKFNHIISAATVLVFLAVVFTGCSKSKVIESSVVDLKLSVSGTEIAPGNKLQFTVSSEQAPESDLDIKVYSSDKNIASVPESVVLKAGDGAVSEYITALAEGEAVITITSEDDVAISANEVRITVKENANNDIPRLSIYSIYGEVAPGAKIPFEIRASKASGIDAVINITSDNTAAAVVPASLTLKKGEKAVTGEITGVATGEAVISISSEVADIENSSLYIRVAEGAATVPILSISSAPEVTVGETIKYTVSTPVAPDTDVEVAVTSNNPECAVVTSPAVIKAGQRFVEGEITGVSSGRAVVAIVAAIPIGSGTVEISVIESNTEE